MLIFLVKETGWKMSYVHCQCHLLWSTSFIRFSQWCKMECRTGSLNCYCLNRTLLHVPQLCGQVNLSCNWAVPGWRPYRSELDHSRQIIIILEQEHLYTHWWVVVGSMCFWTLNISSSNVHVSPTPWGVVAGFRFIL